MKKNKMLFWSSFPDGICALRLPIPDVMSPSTAGDDLQSPKRKCCRSQRGLSSNRHCWMLGAFGQGSGRDLWGYISRKYRTVRRIPTHAGGEVRIMTPKP